MMFAIATSAHAGWLPGTTASWWFVAVWLVIVLVYGLYRSSGQAAEDPIRPSGPFE